MYQDIYVVIHVCSKHMYVITNAYIEHLYIWHMYVVTQVCRKHMYVVTNAYSNACVYDTCMLSHMHVANTCM